MESKKIVVIGSTNMDMVVKTSHIPAHGETVLGGSFFMNPGGKGANQAVAAARLGGDVIFISRIGNDVFGKKSFQIFDEEGIDTRYILTDDKFPSGVALIIVDNAGENSIVVAPGANAELIPDDINAALGDINKAGIVLMQLEIPLKTVEFIVQYANAKGVKVILNPAPATVLPAEVLSHIDIITPNITEASMISDMEVTDILTAKNAAKIIHEMGVKHVVITMGSDGAIIYSEGQFHTITTDVVEAVDSTAAGDVFNGALAVSLSEGKDLVDSVRFACEAATISVTRLGAQSSIPYRNELIGDKQITE